MLGLLYIQIPLQTNRTGFVRSSQFTTLIEQTRQHKSKQHNNILRRQMVSLKATVFVYVPVVLEIRAECVAP